MNPFILQALKFALPSLRLLFSQLPLTATQSYLADIVLRLLGQAVGVAATPGKAMFGASASAVAGVPLPPEHEWTPEGIERWAEENAAGPDTAA